MAVLDEGYRKARKNYWCDGWHWLDGWYHDVEGLEICKGIHKGEEYYFQVNSENLNEGSGTFRCCKQCKEQSERHNIPMEDTYQ